MFGPIGWAWDKVTGFVGDVATEGFQAVVGGLVAWVLDAVVWIVQGVFNNFIDATDPNVQADWFITGNGPYATMATIGASLMAIFLSAGIAQGVATGDVAGMLRRMALDLPLAVLGMIGLVTVTQALVRLTDQLTSMVLAGFQDDMDEFVAAVGSIANLGGGVATAFVVFLLGLIAVLAGTVLIGELAVRSALVYIVVALAPLAFAAQLWPGLKGISQKLLKLLAALIISKLVIAVALAVAAGAAVGTGSGGEVTALPEPEVVAEDPGGSVTQAVGLLLTTGVAFVVAAFSPLLVARLFPLAEDAAAAQGIRGMPARAFQQTLSTAYSLQMLRMYRHRGLASGQSGGGPDAGEGGGPGGGPGGSRPGGRPTPGTGSQGGAARGAGSRSAAGRSAAGAGTAGAAGGGASAAGAAAGPAGVAAVAAKEAGSKATGAAKQAAQRVKQQADGAVDSARSGSPSGGRRPSPTSGGSATPGPSASSTPTTTSRPRPKRRPPTGASGG